MGPMQQTRTAAPSPRTRPRTVAQRPVGDLGPPHVLVDGIPVFDGGLGEAVAWCLAKRSAGVGVRVATANLDFFALASANPVLRADLCSSSLVVADGAPVAWLARLAGARRARRVAGVDFAREICAEGARGAEWRVALYGSTPEVCAEAAEALQQDTRARVVTAISPPFRPLTDWERHEYLGQLASARPDVVLVALGCPAQERFIADSFNAIPGAIWIGVGGTLDFFAGRKRRAPGLAQRVGMEWFVRFAQEPRRLGPRYFGRDLPALGRLLGLTLSARLRRAPRTDPVAVR